MCMLGHNKKAKNLFSLKNQVIHLEWMLQYFCVEELTRTGTQKKK